MEGDMPSVITMEEKRTPSLNIGDELNSTIKWSKPNDMVSPGRFKGVVSQPNGHWGAQIYAKHHRFWLGTFKSENEAATAYDGAVIKLRGRDAPRNFPWNKQTLQEPKFQDQYSTREVLDMIKDGSYPLKFAEFLRTKSGNEGPEAGLSLPSTHGGNGVFYRHLFQKALTPSDVGSLNRVVIPKACALKYFPQIFSSTHKEEENSMKYFPMTLTSTEEVKDNGAPKAFTLEFYDGMMKSWNFRYCYWTSSQSYVFTKGWNRFVKDRGLKPGDIVAFYACEIKEGATAGQAFCMIDVLYNRENDGSATVKGIEHGANIEAGTQLCLGQLEAAAKDSVDLELVHSPERKRFKLFGEWIC